MCLLSVGALAAAAPTAHGQKPEPLEVTSTSPADGASIEQTRDRIPFSVRVVRDPPPPYVYISFSNDPTLNSDGFLEFAGSSTQLFPSPGDPTLYVTDDHSVYEPVFERPQTVYWHAYLSGGELGWAVSPIYSINVTARPAFLSTSRVMSAIRFQILSKRGTGRPFASLKRKCTRVSSVFVTCSVSWKTKTTARFSYDGVFRATLTDGPELDDPFTLRFAGERVKRTCLKRKSAARCAEPEAWTRTFTNPG